MTNEIQYPSEGTVEYEAVLLDEENQNSDTGAVSGLVIDGITVRVDDLYFAEPEKEGDEYEMRVEYKLVDGIPENITDFEAKLSNVMIQLVNDHNKSTGE